MRRRIQLRTNNDRRRFSARAAESGENNPYCGKQKSECRSGFLIAENHAKIIFQSLTGEDAEHIISTVARRKRRAAVAEV